MKLDAVLELNRSGFPFKNSYCKYEYFDVMDTPNTKGKVARKNVTLENSIEFSSDYLLELDIKEEGNEINVFVTDHLHYLDYIEKYISDITLKRALRTGLRKTWDIIRRNLLFVDKVKQYEFSIDSDEVVTAIKEYITGENLSKYYHGHVNINTYIMKGIDVDILTEISKRKNITYNITYNME